MGDLNPRGPFDHILSSVEFGRLFWFLFVFMFVKIPKRKGTITITEVDENEKFIRDVMVKGLCTLLKERRVNQSIFTCNTRSEKT